MWRTAGGAAPVGGWNHDFVSGAAERQHTLQQGLLRAIGAYNLGGGVADALAHAQVVADCHIRKGGSGTHRHQRADI